QALVSHCRLTSPMSVAVRVTLCPLTEMVNWRFAGNELEKITLPGEVKVASVPSPKLQETPEGKVTLRRTLASFWD
ncbi:hypothetical protein, partial [Meiothermus cerbereus]|uniref:hypothetical protein n=1 Tax=Meiothermus cerbereus TaxID=65552 RepID=UPI002FDA73C4